MAEQYEANSGRESETGREAIKYTPIPIGQLREDPYNQRKPKDIIITGHARWRAYIENIIHARLRSHIEKITV